MRWEITPYAPGRTLGEYQFIFTFDLKEMSGVHPMVMEYQLNVDLVQKPMVMSVMWRRQ